MWSWKQIKIGGGTPPVLTRHNSLIIYFGVSEVAESTGERAPSMLLFGPGRWRSGRRICAFAFVTPKPVLTPLLPQERQGTVEDDFLTTGIDQHIDLGITDRFDVYYGMADNRIGVARLDMPNILPPEALVDHPDARGYESAHRQMEVWFPEPEMWSKFHMDAQQIMHPWREAFPAQISRNLRHIKTERIMIMKPNDDEPQDPNEAGIEARRKDDLKSLPLPEVMKKLGSSPDGLSQAEAEKRLTQYGPNEIEEKKTNPLLKFLTYFWGPIPWMIEAAVILSAVNRSWPDFAIILLLLLANAVVGFWEEHQAGNAIAALKATLAIKARVKRDGKWINPVARSWCRATSSVCAWATLCRRMRACWTAIRWKSISPP